MDTDNKKYFFEPRVGINYNDGFKDLRTLVLGAYHICSRNCCYKNRCCNIDLVADMDYKCPDYSNAPRYDTPEDELCLHNSNIIEITSYCDDNTQYPTYTAFTRYMLECKTALTSEQKNDFWDNVAFCNFYQCFSSSDIMCFENDADTMNKNAVEALRQIIDTLNPQVVYVWTKELSDVIDSNIDDFPGLKKESLPREHSTIELYMYSYNHSINTVTLKDVQQYLQQYFPNRDITLTKEGVQKKVLPLEKVILRAIKRNTFMFDNGQLIVSANSKELEVGYILSSMRLYYTFNNWKEIELIITKDKKDGGRIKNLRQTRRYHNNNTNTKEAKELDKNIFGIK
ncbi:MAG: hypothetical protein IKY22_02145 [Bacteroidales bacterium]|nr:hypothetical protein [Bacteroidales bacterium]